MWCWETGPHSWMKSMPISHYIATLHTWSHPRINRRSVYFTQHHIDQSQRGSQGLDQWDDAINRREFGLIDLSKFNVVDDQETLWFFSTVSGVGIVWRCGTCDRQRWGIGGTGGRRCQLMGVPSFVWCCVACCCRFLLVDCFLRVGMTFVKTKDSGFVFSWVWKSVVPAAHDIH